MMTAANLTGKTSGLGRLSLPSLLPAGTYGGPDTTPNPLQSVPKKARSLEPRDYRRKRSGQRICEKEVQHLIQRLEVRASEKTADLIADEGRIDMPDDVHEEPQPSHLEENATLQREMGDFDGLLTIIQGYATMMKADLDDPTKLKEDIEAISEAAFLVKALINSQQRPR